MGSLSSLLNRPEYIHVAINHFPILGLFVAMLTLIAGLIFRARAVTLTGLGLVCLLALSIWPVYAYGESGYDRVLSMSDEPGEAFLKYHAELAHRWAFLYYLTAGVAALSLGIGWKKPPLLFPAAIVTLLLAIASLAAGVAIAHAGGEVRHREFRSGPPPHVARGRNPKAEGRRPKEIRNSKSEVRKNAGIRTLNESGPSTLISFRPSTFDLRTSEFRVSALPLRSLQTAEMTQAWQDTLNPPNRHEISAA